MDNADFWIWADDGDGYNRYCNVCREPILVSSRSGPCNQCGGYMHDECGRRIFINPQCDDCKDGDN